MNWNSEAIVISNIVSGESGNVVVTFSKDHGKWSGFSNLTKNRKVSVGDICYATWSNRLEEGLGNFKFELFFSPYQYNFANNTNLLIIQSVASLLNTCLADRDSNPDLYTVTYELLNNLTLARYALWELAFLQHIGYGLDFSKCAITGQKDGLYYVSPKTGHCVIKSVGEPYKDRLFVIPPFWLNDAEPHLEEIYESLKITGAFIAKRTERQLLYRDMLMQAILLR